MRHMGQNMCTVSMHAFQWRIATKGFAWTLFLDSMYFIVLLFFIVHIFSSICLGWRNDRKNVVTDVLSLCVSEKNIKQNIYREKALKVVYIFLHWNELEQDIKWCRRSETLREQMRTLSMETCHFNLGIERLCCCFRSIRLRGVQDNHVNMKRENNSRRLRRRGK